MSDRYAPEGKLWVCLACGKTSDDLYGIDGKKTMYGWDESCMLNASIFDESDIHRDEKSGRVVRIGDPKVNES